MLDRFRAKLALALTVELVLGVSASSAGLKDDRDRLAHRQGAWIDSKGVPRSQVDLDYALRKHNDWLSDVARGRARLLDTRRLDLRGSALTKINLDNADLRYARLDSAVLTQASLRNARLEEAILDKASLRDANLEGSVLSGASLIGANCVRANFKSAILKEAILLTADLRKAQLERANLTKAFFSGANLEGANLSNATAVGATGIGANFYQGVLTSVNFSHSKLQHSIFSKALANDVDFTRALLDHASFDDANLLDAVLTQASMMKSSFKRAQLSGARLERANLRSAVLDGASLNGAYLEGAMLAEASLRSASLVNASLKSAYLGGIIALEAVLTSANLSNSYLERAVFSSGRASEAAILKRANLEKIFARFADFRHVNMEEATLLNATLTQANLSYTNLCRADLSHASLRKSDITGSDLTGSTMRETDVAFADLRQALYEPSTQPPVHVMHLARNLSTLTWNEDPRKLAELQSSFREVGLSRSEKQVATAMRRHDALWWEVPLFDWTYEYGSNGARPALLLLCLWLACTPIYLYALYLRGRRGLYLVVCGKRIDAEGQTVKIRKLSYQLGPILLLSSLKQHRRSLSTALFFSFRSTLNIGFGDLSFDRWIRMLHKRDFDLKARGWPRVVAGLQSLVSLFLVALTLISYFGSLS